MKHSDFADEWFEKEEETIFSEKIEKFPHSVTVKWIKVSENDKAYQVGDSVTISFESMADASLRNQISSLLVDVLDKLCKEVLLQKILVVGLGNEEMISDAIGPKTAAQILVSAHLFELENNVHPGLNNCAVIAPKVM